MKNNSKKWWLYVLKLEQGKYYVGITSKTPAIRMQEHINGIRPAYWTIKYKPEAIIFEEDLGLITKEEAEKLENKKTRELLKEFGLNNVRGGDIKTTKDLIRRFGYYWDAWDWEVFMTVIFLMIIIVILTII